MKSEKLFLKCQWLAFLLFPKYLTSGSIIVDQEHPLSSYDIEIAMKVISPSNYVCNCHYIKARHKNEIVISSIYQRQLVSLVMGDTVITSLCKDYIFIVENQTDVEELSTIINSDFNRIILVVITLSCPVDIYQNASYFGKGQIIIICVATNSTYLCCDSRKLIKVDNVNFSSQTRLKLPNYGGKFLKGSTFNCPVYSYGTEDNKPIWSSPNEIEKLDGIEMKIFLEISKHLNFTWKLEQPREINKWGQKYSNGTWSGGIVGALVNKDVDIGFCCLWITSPQAQDIDLTIPWNILCSTLLVPRPRRLQKLGAVFFPFTASLWAILIVSTFFISMILWCLQRIRQEAVSSTKVHTLGRNIQDFIGIITLGSMPSSNVQIHECRHISTWWAVFALMMTTAYSSSLVSHLTVPLFDSPVDFIKDLVMADVHWSQSYFPPVEVIFDLENPWHKRFIKNFQLDPETAKFHHSFQTTDHASLGFILEGERPYFLEPVPMHPTLLPSLRVMKECVSRYYISLGLTKNSQYTAAFNEVMSRLIESGIIKHWQEDIVLRRSSPQMSQVFEDTDGNISGPEVLRLENLQGAFLLLACGLCVGTLVLLIEKYILQF